jgi:hypothetical protein
MSWSISAVGTRQAVLDYVKSLPEIPWSGSPEVNTKQYQAARGLIIAELDNLEKLKVPVYSPESNSGTPGVRVDANGHASDYSTNCKVEISTVNVRV